MSDFKKRISKYWNLLNIAIAVPLSLGFIILGIFGQLCIDNLPFAVC